jgi:lipid A 3-O-deacylase
MIKRSAAAAAFWVAATLSAPAFAIDGFSVEAGRGEGIDMGRIGVQWDWNRQLLKLSDWQLGGYFDLAIGQWHHGDAAAGQNDNITEIGLTPVFRLEGTSRVGPYLEAAIGFHLLSHTQIADKRLSTAFQFGDHLGFGYKFGARNAFDLGYRFQHLSNGSIKRPNPGVNFHQIRLQYHF